MEDRSTPSDLRDGVRSGILDSIRLDVERRGGRTAGLLALAGALGVMGGLGATLLISGHPFDHHPTWHVRFFSAVWTGLLVVASAIVLLEVGTPTLPLTRSASVGLMGLGLAGVCGMACPDPHFLRWWVATSVGGSLVDVGGEVLAALCFGLATTIVIALAASFLVFRGRGPERRRFLPPALALVALLAPGVVLQSVGTSVDVLLGWLLGTAAGALVGVMRGLRIGVGRRAPDLA